MFASKLHHLSIFLASAPLGLAQLEIDYLPPSASGDLSPWAVTDDGRTVLGDAGVRIAGWSAASGAHVLAPTPNVEGWPWVASSHDLARFAWRARPNGVNYGRAYRMSASQSTPELLEVPAGTTRDVAPLGMSSDGDWVAGYAGTQLGTVPIIWDAAGLASIPYPSGVARAVSDDGQTVLIQDLTSLPWDSLHISPQASVTSINATLPPGWTQINVVDMSGDGTWVIGTYFDGQYYQSFRWSIATGPEPLDLPGGSVLARSISRDGSTIVGWNNAGPWRNEAVFWTEATGVVVLRPFLVANGFPATPALPQLRAVSPDGQTLAGATANGAFIVSFGTAPRPEVGSIYCGPAVPHSAGLSATCKLIGTPSVWANDLTVEANDLPPNRFGFFITSDQVGFVAQPGGSAGNLCLSGAIGRYVRPGEVQQSNANGSFSLNLDLPTTPTVGGIVPPIMAGTSRHFQAWFRDNASATSSNFTSGVSVTFR